MQGPIFQMLLVRAETSMVRPWKRGARSVRSARPVYTPTVLLVKRSPLVDHVLNIKRCLIIRAHLYICRCRRVGTSIIKLYYVSSSFPTVLLVDHMYIM